MAVLALRIDVDTHDGLRVGVPRMLELLRRHGVCATFFVTFGPERAGLALSRAWDPGFIWKMVRTQALRTYGWRTVLSGTLLTPRPVGESFGALLRDVMAEGHELGLHGYDHFGWQHRIHRMGRRDIEAAFRTGIGAFASAVGQSPSASAAPGWRTTAEALAVQEQFGFRYASDARGVCPFRVQMGRVAYATLQIPTTMPTMDELVGTVRDISGVLESTLRPGLNVFTAHAEVEGGPFLGEFERFLQRARGTQILRLIDVAAPLMSGVERVPSARIARGRIRGRSGWVLVQQGSADGKLAQGSSGDGR